jgi:GMP synthase-like glutamine amidotransferase
VERADHGAAGEIDERAVVQRQAMPWRAPLAGVWVRVRTGGAQARSTCPELRHGRAILPAASARVMPCRVIRPGVTRSQDVAVRCRTVRALVISHDPSEEAGLVGACLEQRGFRLEPFVVCESTEQPVSHRPFPSIDGIDLVVAMGAPWSVDDTATIGSWIGRELDFVRAVHRRAVPYLGVCFGAQVLAAALGGRVERAPHPELGWVRVQSARPEAIAPGPWFQWHRDRFVAPPGAVELARNDAGVQAFRIGQSVGVQFHPEVDAALLQRWLGDDGEVPDALFTELGVDPRDVLADARRADERNGRDTAQLVDWFLEEVS